MCIDWGGGGGAEVYIIAYIFEALNFCHDCSAAWSKQLLKKAKCFINVLQSGYAIFCYNIGNNATERTLWQLFSPFGTVQKVNVIMEPGKGICKGYGFVTMTNYQEAQNAINHLHGFYFQGRPLQVSFKT